MDVGWERSILCSRGWLLPSLCLALLGGAVHAQGSSNVSGQVVDTAGRPVAGALVELLRAAMRGTTSTGGEFLFQEPPPGLDTLVIRSIGYSTVTRPIAIDRVQGWHGSIALSASPFVSVDTIPSTVVEAERPDVVARRLEEFQRRRRREFGVFLDETDIEARMPLGTVNLFSGLAGVRVYLQSGTGGRVEFVRCTERRVGVWINGFRSMAADHNAVLNEIHPKDIIALEIYRGVAQIPGEFLSDACAAIAIWTR